MQRRFQAWLDGVDAVASTIYLTLVALVVGAVLGAFAYIVWHWDGSWGTQGEGFYLIVAVLLVIGWGLGQLAFLIQRRRRNAWTFEDGSELPLPKIDITGDGIKATWSADTDVNQAAQPKAWTFSFGSTGTRTFKLDAAALMTAKAARADGKSWTDIARVMNPQWETLPAMDRMLYERALEAAVRDATPKTP